MNPPGKCLRSGFQIPPLMDASLKHLFSIRKRCWCCKGADVAPHREGIRFSLIFPNHHSFRHIWRLRARTNKGFRLKKVSHLRTCLRSLVAREGSRPVSWGLWLTYLTDHTFRCGPVNIWRATLINPKERLNIGLCLQSCTF